MKRKALNSCAVAAADLQLCFRICKKQVSHVSHVVRKPAFCICENKDADQLRGNRNADQRLCFRYTDSTIPLFSKYEISSLWPSSVVAQPGLCRTWSETPKTGFLPTRLIYSYHNIRCNYHMDCLSDILIPESPVVPNNVPSNPRTPLIHA